MHIKRVEINDLRGIRHLEINDLQDINIFIGENNSCKTTTLEAIFLLVGISNPELIDRINLFRGLVNNEKEDLKYVFYNLDYQNEILLKADFLASGESRELKIHPFSNITEKKVITKNEDTQSLQNFDTDLISPEINMLNLDFSIRKKGTKKKNYKTSFSIEGSGIKKFNSLKNYKETYKGVYINPNNDLGDLDKRLENIVKSKQKKEIIEILKTIDNKINDISLGTNGNIYIDIGLEKLIHLALIGDGIKRILRIILSIYHVKNGFIIIDEIENGLHYKTMKILWEIIIKATKKFNVQLFATTHSSETIKYLKEASEENKNDKKRIRNYTLRKKDDDNIIAYKYDFDKIDFSLEQEIEIR